ncbi:hypothetical protein SODALDRAFT_195894 [Sodiomyces alkalinus F11]|uniref:Bromodomain associated domain-containing protein n=1 Tax=Sodiomyces alkalinus (strain CBS 110278 / VKM F-3762 / F11) TaxID=1314773 RepID=A0A3N2PSC8_SODAK|nr:hypothetical protein SODALDRAFT_195894 [Sodiomyces alkalinus F11]ROT37407.1 hypothetical protein SODALDRAFT_195894 [Sodiomyces alkalinus F11]
MTPPTTLFHAFLRPCVLQILRATGYHAARPVVIDTFTELAARYLLSLCHATSAHALDNASTTAAAAAAVTSDGLNDDEETQPYDSPINPSITIVNVRMALEEAGAFAIRERFLEPDPGTEQQRQHEQLHQEQRKFILGSDRDRMAEDTRGVDEFIAWFSGSKCRAIREMVIAGLGDGVVTAGTAEGDSSATDYLNALLSKHSKSTEDFKFHGTILGKGIESSPEVLVEGGELSSIHKWMQMMRSPSPPSSPVRSSAADSRPPSSGLSSVGDRLGDEKDSMELS